MRRDVYSSVKDLRLTRRSVSRAVPLGVFLAGMLWSANAFAGATINIDDTHSVSIGAGLRGSFTAL